MPKKKIPKIIKLSDEETLKALNEDVTIEDDESNTVLTMLSVFDNDSKKVELTKSNLVLRKQIIKAKKIIEKNQMIIDKAIKEFEKDGQVFIYDSS